MRKGQKASEELRKRLSEAHKGQVNPRKGKVLVPKEERVAKRKAWRRAYDEKNRDRLRAQGQEWKEKNREHVNAMAKERYHVSQKEKQLSRHRMRTYGMDDKTFYSMVEAQNGKCLICGDKTEINLSIDHNHTTGKIRGLICNACNIAIAKAKDSPEILRAMADYLEKYDG